MFNDREYRFGALAGVAALILVLALTAMAFTALEPAQSASRDWSVSMPEASGLVTPTYSN